VLEFDSFHLINTYIPNASTGTVLLNLLLFNMGFYRACTNATEAKVQLGN
jgi:hypothetical protein